MPKRNRREYQREYQREYYKSNRENILKYQKERKENIGESEESKNRRKSYYKENRDRILRIKKAYRVKNRNNPELKSKRFIRNCLSRIINKAKYESGALNYLFKDTDSDKIKLIIGCSIEKFIHHIESQFKEGMSWINHGEWHIDHDFPLSVCIELYGAERSLSLANHYTNLTPMWSSENLTKSNKI